MEYMAHILALAGVAEPLVAQTDGNAIGAIVPWLVMA
jgi:hypothetical protein